MRLNAEALRGGFRLIGSILLWLAVVIAVIGWGGAHQPEMDALHRSVFYSMAQDCALRGIALVLLSYCELDSPRRIRR